MEIFVLERYLSPPSWAMWGGCILTYLVAPESHFLLSTNARQAERVGLAPPFPQEPRSLLQSHPAAARSQKLRIRELRM